MVKKTNGKWMYTNYIDLNKACPNDVYPLPSIDPNSKVNKKKDKNWTPQVVPRPPPPPCWHRPSTFH